MGTGGGSAAFGLGRYRSKHRMAISGDMVFFVVVARYDEIITVTNGDMYCGAGVFCSLYHHYQYYSNLSRQPHLPYRPPSSHAPAAPVSVTSPGLDAHQSHLFRASVCRPRSSQVRLVSPIGLPWLTRTPHCAGPPRSAPCHARHSRTIHPPAGVNQHHSSNSDRSCLHHHRHQN